MSTCLTIPRSVMGRWISGSWTDDSAAVTCSADGGAETVGWVAMPSCYEPRDRESNVVGARGPHHVRSVPGLAGDGVEEVRLEVRVTPVEQAAQRARPGVGRAADPLPVQPVVLDEAGDRRLVG